VTGRGGVEVRLGAQRAHRVLARHGLGRLGISQTEADPVDLVGARPDHRVHRLTEPSQVVDDHGDLVGRLVAGDAGRLVVPVLHLRVQVEAAGLDVALRHALGAQGGDHLVHGHIIQPHRLARADRAAGDAEADGGLVGGDPALAIGGEVDGGGGEHRIARGGGPRLSAGGDRDGQDGRESQGRKRVFHGRISIGFGPSLGASGAVGQSGGKRLAVNRG
jgi:hypothetical protein